MYVVGTAGHVDHGKSTLIEALTGIDPDRLQQEKARGMTIELGFAWTVSPGGAEISIVDVPGHERFVKNMLMGAGGIDLALLIVAADEGVMPQTREHLAILDLLEVRRGIAVITKRDLVDRDWLDMVAADMEETLEGTTLEGSPVVPVSAVRREGLDELLQTLARSLEGLPEKADVGRPRLPVDRSFTMPGFGAVVTGTLIDGRLRPGQEVELQPSGLRARVRGLQTHRTAVDEAAPGTRVAVNLSGIDYRQIARGHVLTTPGWLHPTRAIDASLRLIDAAPRPLKHNARVTFYTGTSETQARVRLLAADAAAPGDIAWAQVRLDEPVAVVKGDYFVIRDTQTTLGGGVLVALHARRHRRFHGPTIARLEALARGSGAEALIGALESIEPASEGELARAANLSEAGVRKTIEDMASDGRVVRLGEGAGLLYSARGWAGLAARAREALESHHRQFPLRAGMPKEELRSRLGMRQAAFAPALVRLAVERVLETTESEARLPDRQVRLSAGQECDVERYLELLASSPHSPPTDAPLEPDLLQLLDDQGRVVRAADGVVFLKSAYDEMAEWVAERAREHASVSIADVRETFGTSRKYTLALLEHMDRTGVTRRVGDDRVLR